MKLGRHPLGFRIYGRMAELRNRLSRARYFRGHGVHSPFVYDLVRQVFMRDSLLPGPRDLHDAPACPRRRPAAGHNCKTWPSTAAMPPSAWTAPMPTCAS